MRITKQPSGGSSETGGRGEFELAEDVPGGPRVTDLFDHDLVLRYGPVELPTGIFLTKQGGKRRLRLRNNRATFHIGRQAAAVLMLPTPIRDEARLEGGQPVLRSDGYLLHHIQLQDVRVLQAAEYHDGEVSNPGLFRATADSVIYGNQAFQAETLDVERRMSEVIRLWQSRNGFPADLAALLAQHEAAVTAGEPVPRELTQTVENIQTTFAAYSSDMGVVYSQYEDVVPALLLALGEEVDEADRPLSLEQIPPDQLDIRRREIEKWQVWVRRRGPASTRFKREVREAYDWTCAVCGNRFPPTDMSRKPGVDAAHILPWADFDLDHVSNGICLCKQHHWAFDEGLLRIVHRDGSYHVELAPGAEEAILEPHFTLDALRSVTGVVPVHRLPNIPAERPNPEFLRRLYDDLV